MSTVLIVALQVIGAFLIAFVCSLAAKALFEYCKDVNDQINEERKRKP